MTRLANEVIVVTGGAQGLGAAFAKRFAREGALVVIADLSDASSTVESITGAGGEAISTITDITDNESLQAMVETAEQAFGPVSVLMNNAALFAGMDLKPFMNLENEDWDLMLKVNVRGLWQASKAVVPSMRRGGKGKIINIASGTVHRGPPGQLHYVASKGAVLAMTRSMARELAADNINVNSISPSLTLSDGVMANDAWEPFKENVVASRIIQRDMLPSDLEGTAVFLASTDSNFITGQSINVDGGVQLT